MWSSACYQLYMACNTTWGLSLKTQQPPKNEKKWSNPIVGIGQGNGAGPPIWAALSTPLFQILTSDQFLVDFYLCTLGTQMYFSGFWICWQHGLVHQWPIQQDTDSAERIQQSLNLWVWLLWVTRWALVLEKCFWYLLGLEWSPNGKWVYHTHHNFQLTLADDTGTKVWLPVLEASDARWTLGVHLAPNGDSTMEFQHLQESQGNGKQQWPKPN